MRRKKYFRNIHIKRIQSYGREFEREKTKKRDKEIFRERKRCFACTQILLTIIACEFLSICGVFI